MTKAINPVLDFSFWVLYHYFPQRKELRVDRSPGRAIIGAYIYTCMYTVNQHLNLIHFTNCERDLYTKTFKLTSTIVHNNCKGEI